MKHIRLMMASAGLVLLMCTAWAKPGDPFCLTANEDGCEVWFTVSDITPKPAMEYSTSGATWAAYTFDTKVRLNRGDKIYFRAATDTDQIIQSKNAGGTHNRVKATGSVAASGDLTTVLNRHGTTRVPAGTFREFFTECEGLTTPPELPATELGDECYNSMFSCCTNLTVAPALPATTLEESCYGSMFEGCTALKNAPALPATVLAARCYQNMFEGCTSLTTAPDLPATEFARGCYSGMFRDCTSLNSVSIAAKTDPYETSALGNWLYNTAASGVVYCPAELELPSGPSGLPDGWSRMNRVVSMHVADPGVYRTFDLADLGIEPPPAGTVYSVKAYGLPSGLKLKYNAAVKKGKKVITKAKTKWWIEGVPTATLDAQTNPMYLAVTVGKKTTWYPILLSVTAQAVTDMGTFTVGTALNEVCWLPGVTNGWSVSGLPKGLSYTAKTVYVNPKAKKKVVKYAPYTTYGKFSAAGLYTVTAKKKKGSFYETLKFRVLVNPAGEFVTRNFTAYETFATMKDKNWKAVSGLPAGLKFTAKKYAVSGKITKAGTFAVTFTDKKGRKTTEMWQVAANPAGPSLGFNTMGETTMSVLQGQKGKGNELTFLADGTVSVSGLPKGMKLVKNTDGTYALGGVPSKTGTYFVTVKAAKNGRTVTQRVAVTVKANPVKGTYYGYSQDKSIRYRTASLTIAASGKATLKYTEGSKTYTLTTTAGKPERDEDVSLYVYTFVQKANTKKKIPARAAKVYLGLNDLGQTIGEWGVCTGTTWSEGTMLCEGGVYKALSAAAVNAIRTDPETGFAAKATYVLTGKADPAEVIYATYAYSSKTGKFTVKGKLPRGKAFSATVPAITFGNLMLAPISAADADGSRYLLMLTPGGGGRVLVDGFGSGDFDSHRYDFGTGYGTLPTTFKAAIANTVTNYMPVMVTYAKKGDPATSEEEEFCIRAYGTKYFQVSFDEGKTWSAKTAYKYDKARGLITLSFTKGKTKYALDLLYAQPELLYGQIKRQSNPVYNKRTKKTTYTTEYGVAVACFGL